jgi:pre-mRNA-processing factor SLU7
VTKFRKGACTNCGAMTHTVKTCCERPRKVGARFSNRDFCRDETIEELEFDSYDAKRDRWNGYDPNAYKSVIKEWTKVEEEKV